MHMDMENNQKKAGTLTRCSVLLVGLALWAYGIAFSVRAGLGVSPVASMPYVVSQVSQITMGGVMVMMQVVALIVQLLVSQWSFKKAMLWQLAASMVFGILIDLALYTTEGIDPSGYAESWLYCAVSIVVTALGVSMYAKSDVAMTAIDGLKSILSKHTGDGLGMVSICCEGVILAMAAFISFFWFDTIVGIREGTLASAVLVVVLVHLIGRHADRLYRAIGLGGETVTSHTSSAFASGEAREQGAKEGSDTAPLVVTITRQFGCDAHEVGKLLAMRIGVPLYDEQLIDRVAERSGLETLEVRRNEQRLPNMLLHRLDVVSNSCVTEQQDLQRQLYDATKTVMEDISQAPCVIIGRLGRHFLGDREGCTHVFLYAPRDYRVRNLARENELTEAEALQRIEKEDNDRETHFKYFTGMDMNDALNYDICIDTSLYGVEGAADLIASAITQMRER